MPPSNHWAAVKHRGETLAEVWFKPDGQPWALTIRIPASSFTLPGLAPLLTPQNLLRSVGIAATEVAACSCDGTAGTDLYAAIPAPSRDVAHVTLTLQLRPPAAPGESLFTEAQWQDLQARWNNILIQEASLETLRITVEGVRSELEGLGRQQLAGIDKFHASNLDVAMWTKAKARVVFAVPKAREFIHRSTWATGSPERKKLEELFKTHIPQRISSPELADAMGQLDFLHKERQVLAAQGNAVLQDCKSIAAEVQGALRTLQRNAATNASKRKAAAGKRGKPL
jgi:hypothetical protein